MDVLKNYTFALHYVQKVLLIFIAMHFFKFLFSKAFFKQIALIIAISLILIWFILKGIDIFTLHGKSINVPDFTGLHIDELDDYVKKRDLRYYIVDSIYDMEKKRGTVVNQNPAPLQKVKRNRTIYLTVIALRPAKVVMPNLKDLTLRQAISVLETYELKVGQLEYLPGFDKNAVLEQKIDGKKIKPGQMIEKGKRIDLVLAKGESDQKSLVPDLIGKTKKEAELLIKKAALNTGSIIFEPGVDTSNAIVYKQSRQPKSKVPLGNDIDIWLKEK